MPDNQITPAQETVVYAMLTAIVANATLTYVSISAFSLNITSMALIVVLAIIITGYIAPRIAARWIGRSVDDIMNPKHPDQLFEDGTSESDNSDRIQ